MEKCCIPGCCNYMHGRCLRFYKPVKGKGENPSTAYYIFVYRGEDGYPPSSIHDRSQRGVKYYCPNHGVSKDSVEEKAEGITSNGVFTVEYPNSEVYKGEVHNDRREGYGEYYYNNGLVYRGEWVNDHEHGKGEYTRGDEIVYKGDFADGRMNGYGVYYYDNGDVYDVALRIA
jgi:chromosome undetermined scaffold_27, whole genome shotgun sequence